MHKHSSRGDTGRRRTRPSPALRRFSSHFALFLTITVGLFLINLAFGGPWWALSLGAAWSIALFAHALQVFGPRLLIGADWEERVAPRRISGV